MHLTITKRFVNTPIVRHDFHRPVAVNATVSSLYMVRIPYSCVRILTEISIRTSMAEPVATDIIGDYQSVI